VCDFTDPKVQVVCDAEVDDTTGLEATPKSPPGQQTHQLGVEAVDANEELYTRRKKWS
jgi:hypothetical protein